MVECVYISELNNAPYSIRIIQIFLRFIPESEVVCCLLFCFICFVCGSVIISIIIIIIIIISSSSSSSSIAN